MKIKSLGSNKTEIRLNNVDILISYETPVAAIRYNGKGALRTEEFFSITTNKHINQWLREYGHDPKIVPSMDQTYFDQLLEGD